MLEEKKKPDEEQTKTETETGTQPPQETGKAENKVTPDEAGKTLEKSVDKNREGADEPTTEESPPKNTTEGETEFEATPPELSETDKLKEENFRLKTQLEAMKIGFMPDVIEDAVVLAENIVKRDGSDISAALQDVAKKYPDWKTDSIGKDGKSKGGFKVGADSSGGKSADDDEKLNKIFGIRKKK